MINDTFTMLEADDDKEKSISTRYHFKSKTGVDGKKVYKVRLVVRGCFQIYGRDYDLTYAPVSKLTCLRLLIGMASCNKWILHHMDVSSAFLNPLIDRKV